MEFIVQQLSGRKRRCTRLKKKGYVDNYSASIHSTASSVLSGMLVGGKRFTVFPSDATRNFVNSI